MSIPALHIFTTRSLACYLAGGSRTVSITWITPLLHLMSVLMTFALPIITLPPVAFTFSAPP